MWNFSVDEDDLFVTLGCQQAQHLLCTLIDLLGKHSGFTFHLFNFLTRINNDNDNDDDDDDDESYLRGIPDEDRLFPDYNDQLKSQQYKLWEEFSFVATNILEKMETKSYADMTD